MTVPLVEPPARTISHLLQRRAATIGAQLCIRCGPEEHSYADLQHVVARRAGTLRASGIEPGDRVAILSENRMEVAELCLACAWLGAIAVPVNAAAKGAQLEHVLASAAPRILVVEGERFASLSGVAAPPAVERLWSLDQGLDERWSGLRAEDIPGLADAVDAFEASPQDPCAVLFTSGTTGPSKGVVCTNAQLYWWGVHTADVLGVTARDVLYTCLPLYHINALNTVVQALVTGSQVEIGPRFSASRFWQRLIDSRATVTYILGTMATILAGLEPSPRDRAHRVRIALAPATPAELHAVFKDRFGVQLVEGHGMTETNFVIGPRAGVQRPGAMGWVRAGFDAMVIDADEREVPAGTPGELVVRPHEPDAFSPGYWALPDATAAAWHNGWFHTGDRVVRDGDGSFTFVDRIKDAIRRRGENVSAWEVEQAVLAHADVAAAAAIPVPSELGEDDVLVCVVPLAGATLDPADLIRHCESRLAFFAVPRYVDIVPTLPLTENGKVKKYELRERGVTSTTWDRDLGGGQGGDEGGHGQQRKRQRARDHTTVTNVASIVGVGETVLRRRARAGDSTLSLLAEAIWEALDDAGFVPSDVDGLGVASFSLEPDRSVDLAWRLGLRVRWLMDGGTGGASALDMLQHARRAVEAGDANVIVLAAGDLLEPSRFRALVDGYNSATRDHLAGIPTGGPTALFALLTQRQMTANGLSRDTYGALVVAQREWAADNPRAAYRAPLGLDEYRAAPIVADPLCIFDCPPVVVGACAIVVSRARPGQRGAVVRSLVTLHNADQQEQDGLTTGLAEVATVLWDDAGVGPGDIDVLSVYDDYPAIVLAQLADLGFVADGDLAGFVADRLATRSLPLNTSGGQLSAGQAGVAGGMHGLAEIVRQLQGVADHRQVPGARFGLVTGYGMVAYRYGACANAAVLEGLP